MPLPEDTHPRGSRLRPRVWLIETTAGLPRLPHNIPVTVDGVTHVVEIHDGDPRPLDCGGFPGRVYRNADPPRLCVLVRAATVTLADGRTGAVVIVWAPALQRNGATPLWDAIEAALSSVLVRSWPCNLDSDGETFLVGALDAAIGAAATLVKNNWPAAWRKRAAGDAPGDMNGTPPAAPTGPRIIGAVIA